MASTALHARAGKFLTFVLGSEVFAIPVMSVREIMGVQEVTQVPQTPDYVKGVFNLRGKVIPVIDLRIKFGLDPEDYTPRTCIVVVQIDSGGAQILTGVIVDEVSEVVTIPASEIEDTPDFGRGVSTPYILGLAKSKGKVNILLDINRVLTAEEMSGLPLL